MTERNNGLDVARALAILGMVIVNYKIVMNAIDGPSVFAFMSRLCEGRASALFVVLAGIGLSLSTNKKRLSTDVSQARKSIIVRGVLLITLGLAYTVIWPADILHFYGSYFLIAALLLTLKNYQLLMAVFFTVAVFPLLMVVLDYGREWNWASLTYDGLWTLEGMFRHMLFNGFHPVFPWFAFLLTGMWLGRQDLSNSRLRKRLLFCSAAIVLSLESIFFTLRHVVGEGSFWGLTQEDSNAFLSLEMIPPLPQYMLVATSSAIFVIVACLYISERLPKNKIIIYLGLTGRMALTLYIAHVVIGMGFLSLIGRLNQQSVGFSLFASTLFFILSILFSALWSRRFKVGPLEYLFRVASKKFI